jgi:hypothetical protein
MGHGRLTYGLVSSAKVSVLFDFCLSLSSALLGLTIYGFLGDSADAFLILFNEFDLILTMQAANIVMP